MPAAWLKTPEDEVPISIAPMNSGVKIPLILPTISEGILAIT